jgi:hypothetical protein
MVVVRNPLSVVLEIQSISIVVEGVPSESYAQTFSLLPLTTKTVMLSLKPLSFGTLTVVGCCVKVWNLEWVHYMGVDGLPHRNVAAAATDKRRRASRGSSSAMPVKPTTHHPVVLTVIPGLPILTAVDVFSHSSPLSTKSGRKTTETGTMFSLMEGQVHQHQIYLENVGDVPVHQLRMVLRTEEEKRGSGDNRGDNRGRTSRLITCSLGPRDVVVFTSEEEEGEEATAAEEHDGGHEVFVWDQTTLDDLRSQLPLAPGQSCTLSLTVDARRIVPFATLVISYSESSVASHTRRLNVPFSLTMEPSLTMRSVDVQAFGHSTPESLMALVPVSNGVVEEMTDARLALVILEVENPTQHPFVVTCRVHRTLADRSPVSRRKSEDTGSSRSGQTYESTFVATFEGNSIQRLVVPVSRENFRRCKMKEKDCLIALDTLMDIYWKSSHGTVGSISLLGRESDVSLDRRMMRLLLPPLVSLSCTVTACNEIEEVGEGEFPELSVNDKYLTTLRRAPPPAVLTTTTSSANTSNATSSSPLPPRFLTSSYPSPIPIYQEERTCFSEEEAEGEVDVTMFQAGVIEGVSTTVSVGDSVRVSVSVRNVTTRPPSSSSSSSSYCLRIVPYVHRGSRVVLLDEEWCEFEEEKVSF